MIAALGGLWKGLNHFEYYGWLFVMANILTAILSLPIVTAPAAYAALSHLSHTAQTTHTASFEDYWRGFRIYFRRGLIIAAANLLIFGIIGYNFYVYRLETGIGFVALRDAWTISLIAWIAVQVYLWPLLDEMETPTLRAALRNALVMLLRNPLFSLTLMFFVLLLLIVSIVTVVPLILITGGLLACIANAAVIDRLDQVRKPPPQL